MDQTLYAIAYDIGTTGIKTCLFEISQKITLLASAMDEYGLQVLENGGAEQNPEDWWKGMARTTRRVLEKSGIAGEQVGGISFCSQMQGLVLVDDRGEAVRPCMSYMDQRAGDEKSRSVGRGLQIQGINIFKILKSLIINGAAPASVKDPLWKYLWVRRHEPELMSRVCKWLDVKDFLIGRCTNRFVMTEDSAFATFLYGYRKKEWSPSLCRMYGIDRNHLPEVVTSTTRIGNLTEEAAGILGLSTGCAVFGGGGDATLIGVGAGAVRKGDTHIYSGTSGWISTVVDRMTIDVTHMIASVIGAEPGRFNYFGELETSGKSLEWVRDHLALDEIGIYLNKQDISQGPESIRRSLYDHLCESIRDVPAGSGGVIFTPWLHGNRCPFEDSRARGIFFNISLDTGKRKLIRAVIEGICYHTRWMMEASSRKAQVSDHIRFVGGGAISPLICQIMADVTGHPIDSVENPQNAGAVGAAVCCGIGLGQIGGFDAVRDFVPVSRTFLPDKDRREVHDRNFRVFKSLYKSNRKNFKVLNGI